MSETASAYNPASVGGALRKGLSASAAQPLASSASLDGASKAAIVLLSLGPEVAGEIVKQFSPAEAQKVSALLASARSLHRDVVIQVLEEFKSTTEHQRQLAFDPQAFVQTMAQKLASQQAWSLGDEIARTMPALETLSNMSPEELHAQLADEHPQVVATLLSLLPPELSAAVIEEFDEEVREELMLRVATLDRINPAVLTELNEMLERSLHSEESSAMSAVGGTRSAAEILNFLSADFNNKTLAAMREHDPKLAQKVADNIFTFEDFMRIAPQSLQRVIPEIPAAVLVVALKGAGSQVREAFLSNMSQRMADKTRFDMEGLPPVRVQEVEARQREIVGIARRLADQNLVSLDRSSQSAASAASS